MFGQLLLTYLTFIDTGEILVMHVTTEPADKEKVIVTMLRKVISVKETLVEELSSEERNCVSDLLQQLQVMCVGARITDSILLFTHLLTTDILKSVHEMFDSGQLAVIVRDLFRCLAKDETLTVEVDIGADVFRECEDGFADDGKSTDVLVVRLFTATDHHYLQVEMALSIISLSTLPSF